MTQQPSRLLTSGYEGLDIEAFLARIGAAGVQTIVDVRDLPLSRKKGFSKKSFAEALSHRGVAYRHMPALGCPKPVRDRYKADKDWAAYTQAFVAYIGGQATATRELVEISKATTACLVCFEADFAACHRTFVARAANRMGGLPVVHLTAQGEVADPGLAPAAAAAAGASQGETFNTIFPRVRPASDRSSA